MAFSARGDVVIPEILTAEKYRRTAEVTDIFNAASRGCILMASRPALQLREGGEYTKPVRFKEISGVSNWADHDDAASTASAVKLAQTKGVDVRQIQRLGPIEWTDDAVWAGVSTAEEWNTNMGYQFADSQLVKIRNNILAAAVAAVDEADTTDGSTASADIHILDVDRGKVSGSKVKFSTTYANRLLAKMGDAREKIELLVMRSEVFADLIKDHVANYKIENVAGTTIVTGLPELFNQTIMVVDAAALTSSKTSDYYSEYYVLGLGKGALSATIVLDTAPELERKITTNLPVNFLSSWYTTEYSIKGMKWEPSSTTENPTDAQLATAASWEENYDDHRHFPVVKGIFNAASGA